MSFVDIVLRFPLYYANDLTSACFVAGKKKKAPISDIHAHLNRTKRNDDLKSSPEVNRGRSTADKALGSQRIPRKNRTLSETASDYFKNAADAARSLGNTTKDKLMRQGGVFEPTPGKLPLTDVWLFAVRINPNPNNV